MISETELKRIEMCTFAQLLQQRKMAPHVTTLLCKTKQQHVQNTSGIRPSGTPHAQRRPPTVSIADVLVTRHTFAVLHTSIMATQKHRLESHYIPAIWKLRLVRRDGPNQRNRRNILSVVDTIKFTFIFCVRCTTLFGFTRHCRTGLLGITGVLSLPLC